MHQRGRRPSYRAAAVRPLAGSNSCSRWIIQGGPSGVSAVCVILTNFARTGAKVMRVAVPLPLPSATVFQVVPSAEISNR